MSTQKEKDDNAFYSRINQFGEYKYNNTLDTLFLLQVTFIVILIFIALYYLNLYGMLSRYALYIITIILTVLLMFIIINKAFVIPRIRSKSVWDQYDFGDRKLSPVPDVASAGASAADGTPPSACTPLVAGVAPPPCPAPISF
jgi:hypothetical protein